MMTGPCTEWRSSLVTGTVPEAGKPFISALAGQFENAAIIGASDEAPGGRLSREATGIGIRMDYLSGAEAGRGTLEVTLFDLCRLVILDHSSKEVARGVSPEAAAASVRADLDRLLPPSYRAPVVEIGKYGPLEGAPENLVLQFRESFRNLAATTDDLLIRESDSEKLRLEGAKTLHNPTPAPYPALKLDIRVGRNADLYVAHLDRETPTPGSETLEAASPDALAGSVMDRLHRLTMSH
jgi:hypothetical protein